MEESGADYAVALKKAQDLGYAEADPTMDVDGSDAAQKLAIFGSPCIRRSRSLARHPAYGARLVLNSPICNMLPSLVIGSNDCKREVNRQGLELIVAPTLLRKGRPLAEVRGAYNAITVVGTQ